MSGASGRSDVAPATARATALAVVVSRAGTARPAGTPDSSSQRTASVRALTPATVASCDRETFDEFLRPLFADDS